MTNPTGSSPDSRRSASLCPPPEALIEAIDAGGGLPLRSLAAHLGACRLCARRLERLRDDAHLHPAELLALQGQSFPGDEAGRFAQLRAQRHLDGCGACRARTRALHGLVVLSTVQGSVHRRRFGEHLRTLAGPLVHRSEAAEAVLDAVLVGADGRLVLRGEQPVVERIGLLSATLKADGRLVITAQVSAEAQAIAFAVASDAACYLLPETPVVDGRASMTYETGIPGVAQQLPADALTAWLRAA